MKLYWSPRSPFVRKVMAFAHQTGLHERIEPVYALVTMDRPNPEVMRVNPLGRIPTLVTDEGAVLYDSAVICEYLDTLHAGERLFPAEGPRRWEALRRQALADGVLETAVLWLAERRRAPEGRSPDLLAAFDRKVSAALAAEEDEAERIAQGPLDIGHLTLGCALGYLDFRFDALAWRARTPRLAEWYRAFEDRPALSQTRPYQE